MTHGGYSDLKNAATTSPDCMKAREIRSFDTWSFWERPRRKRRN